MDNDVLFTNCLQIEKCQTTYGNTFYIVNNHKFTKHHNLQNGQILWRCSRRTCPARMTTAGSSGEIVNKLLNHNHACDIRKVKRQVLSSKCRKRARENLSQQPASIVLQEVLNAQEDNAEFTRRDIKSLKVHIYRARHQCYPPLPATIDTTVEVLRTLTILTDEYKENFLIICDADTRLVVFSTITNLTYLCLQTVIYIDGTSQYCAKHFQHFLTIHTIKNGSYLPLAYCLLPDTQPNTYELLLNQIKTKCEGLFLKLEPKCIYIDCDVNVLTATKQCWPGVKIKFSKYQFLYAWTRKIKYFSLTQELLNEESDISEWLLMLFSLIYFAPAEVKETYANTLLPLKPNNKKLDKFCGHLVKNYINEASIFPPNFWAEDAASIDRVNDNFENYHSSMTSTFYCSRPNIFIFLELLHVLQNSTYEKIASIDDPESLNSDTIQFINYQLDLYREKQIDRFELLKTLAILSKQ